MKPIIESEHSFDIYLLRQLWRRGCDGVELCHEKLNDINNKKDYQEKCHISFTWWN